MKNQAIADYYLSKFEEYSRLLATGHFGADGSEVALIAAGQTNTYHEVGQKLCKHKMTRDTTGVGDMCLVCGKALEEDERGDC